jgi:hypothetical protein
MKQATLTLRQVITLFIINRWKINAPYFTANDLNNYIRARIDAAPASTDRILRRLRQEGKFDYQVTNRKLSEYQIIGIGGSRAAEKTRTVKLLYRGKPIDSFHAKGSRFGLPRHIVDHIFSSSDFELQI